MELKKLLMSINNTSNFNNNQTDSRKNILTIGNSKFITNYKVEDDVFLLKSKDSKLINNQIKYDGEIYLNPFDLNLNIYLEKLNINKLIIKNDILKELLYTKVLFNKNLSANIIIDAEKIVKNKLFDSGKFFLKFNNRYIDLNNSYLVSNKIGKLILENSSLKFIDDQLIYNSAFNFEIKDQKEFYKSFQTPKKNRKSLKNIFLDIEFNLLENNLSISKFSINNKNSESSESVKSILHRYSNDPDNKIKNWIDLKIFFNKIFENYEG